MNENCLNIIRVDTTNKTDFKFTLDKPYNAPKDQRSLGVKIVSINIDGIFTF